MLFVSPELSSGRDLVIQMSVRRAGSAVRRPCFFCPEHISGNILMIFGMWVGLGLKLRMLNFRRGRCLLSINLHNLCKNLSGAFLGNRMPHLDGIWYVGSRGGSRICKKRGPRSKRGGADD